MNLLSLLSRSESVWNCDRWSNRREMGAIGERENNLLSTAVSCSLHVFNHEQLVLSLICITGG